MKRMYLYLFILSISVFMGSCIKNERALLLNEIYAEFDATVMNTPITGQIYPVLTRVPVYGAAVVAANPSITRTSGVVKFRVNLVGAQQTTDQVLAYRAVVTPILPAGVVSATIGTHYTITGTITIPANSSYGEAVVTVLNTGISSATSVGVVLELVGNGTVKPRENYKFLGLQISQI